MRPTRVSSALLALAVSATMLTGCDTGTDTASTPMTTNRTAPDAADGEPIPLIEDDSFAERHVTLNDGRTVVCIGYRYRVLSCDWEHAGAPGGNE